jgi:outer membrane cobalamin receptor
MKYTILHFGMFLFAIHIAVAQGTLTGVITNSENTPLPDANIFIQSLQRGTSADKLGRFQFRNIPPGDYNVTVSNIGYASVSQQVIIKDGETATLTTALTPGGLLLSDVVITGQPDHDANTISQVDIKLRPVNTSQDILRMVPGLFIAQHAGGGKAEQIFLRGFDIDHGTDINLEVDGLPVNMVSHAHGQGYSDLHFLIPELVDHVDFNKGPYYADKGNLTTAGYASFLTRNSLDQNMVKIEGGKFGTLRNVNAINLLKRNEGNKRENLYIASEFFRTDGYFQYNQYFNRINLMTKYNTTINDNQTLTIGASTFTSSWDASGQVPERAVASGVISRFGSIDPTEGGETSRTNAWVKHTAAQDDGGIFENQLYYTKYHFKLISNFTFFLNDPVNGDQITQSESRNIYGYNGNYHRESLLGQKTLLSKIGAGFRYDDVNDIHLYHTRSRKQFINDVARGDIDETNLFAYVNETLYLSHRLSLNAAVRLDHFTFNYTDALTADYKKQSVSKAAVSPKFNISYNATPNLNLFIKSGIGFHSNDTRVVVAESGEDILPKAYGIDIGGTWKLGNSIIVNAALWTLDLNQEFVYVGDEGIVEPSGKTSRKGIDVSIRYQVAPWLYFDTDVNLTDPKAKGEPEGQDYIPLAPTFTSIGGLTFRMKNGLNGSLRYRYMGDRAANEDNSVVADGYFLADAIVKYTRTRFELSFTAENIFNTKWKEAQFDTESRLFNEAEPVSEIHFTPGTPFFLKAGVSVFF